MGEITFRFLQRRVQKVTPLYHNIFNIFYCVLTSLMGSGFKGYALAPTKTLPDSEPPG